MNKDGISWFDTISSGFQGTGGVWAMNKDAIHLTKRMRQTLILTAMGLTAKEIGAALKVTPRTVRHYQAELKRYLSADSLAHLVTVAIRRGLVSMSLNDDDLDDLNNENPLADIEI